MTERFTNRTELAKFLSDISRNSGKVSFVVTYHGTEGNVAIDKEFQKFCAEHSNNEYLQGIKLLLGMFNHYQELRALDEVVADLEDRITALEAKPKEQTEEKEDKPKFF